MRCSTSCLDSNMCWSIFCVLLSRARRRALQGPISGFPFCRFAFTVVNWMARRCCHSSAVRCTSAQLMSGCLCRVPAPTHDAWRRHTLHGVGGSGNRRRRWRRRRWRRQRRVRWQRRRATMVMARRAAATATVRRGSHDRGCGSDGGDMGTAVAATVGSGLVSAAYRCGLRWAWRTLHGTMVIA